MALPAVQFFQPRTAEQAVQFLERLPAARLLAGGTDLIPSMQQGLFSPPQLVDLSRARDLRAIEFFSDGAARLGAGATLAALEAEPEIARRFPVLAAAVAAIAGPLQRNMGTLGGNLCLDTRCRWYNQSWSWRRACGFCLKKDGAICHVAPGGDRCWAAYSGDAAPALLVLGAAADLLSPRGLRRLPLAEFFSSDGARPLRLEKDELLLAVHIPAECAGWRGAYLKFRLRAAIDYPLAGFALAFELEHGRIRRGRVALTAVNPAPRLVPGADALLSGADPSDPRLPFELARLAASAAKPLSTSSLAPAYRRDVLKVYARRALADSLAR